MVFVLGFERWTKFHQTEKRKKTFLVEGTAGTTKDAKIFEAKYVEARLSVLAVAHKFGGLKQYKSIILQMCSQKLDLAT